MEAARVAALRGHDVTLVENSEQLGGTLRFAALVYEPNERLLRWYEDQMRKLPIDLHLSTSMTPEAAASLQPDVILLASGASRLPSKIPGADQTHVLDGNDLRALLGGQDQPGADRKLSLTGRLAVRAGRAVGITNDPSQLRKASRAYMPLGKRIVVIGGGLVGVELADFLSERGREVTVVEEGPDAAVEMAHPRRWRILFEVREAGVQIVTDAQVLEIERDAVRFAAPAEPGGEPREQRAAADHVILATGLAGDPDATLKFAELGIPVLPIGDIAGVEYIEGAIHQGFRAANEV